MITNIQSLKDKAKNCAKANNLSVQQVLQNYMFERLKGSASHIFKKRDIIRFRKY